MSDGFTDAYKDMASPPTTAQIIAAFNSHGHKVTTRARIYVPDKMTIHDETIKEITIDPKPWELYFKPMFEYRPIIKWASITVTIGSAIQVLIGLTPGLGMKLYKNLDLCLDKHVFHKNKIKIEPTSGKGIWPIIELGDDIAILRMKNETVPLSRYGQEAVKVLAAWQNILPVQIFYLGQLTFKITNGYDPSMLPEAATEVIREYL